MTGADGGRRRDGLALLAGVAVFPATGLALWAMGQPLLAPDGGLALWGGSEHSKHILDWYTPSHIVHGFLFYLVLWLLMPRQPLAVRAALALAVEAAWEIVENTPWVIQRYRDVTVAADYVGDTIVNSLFDLVAMLAGFILAARLPVRLTVALAVALELAAAWAIRDNLTLNVIMLIWPMDAILAWQSGG